MFQIETDRLKLIPLGVALLREMAVSREALHKYMGLEPYTLQIEPDFEKEIMEALPGWIEAVENRPDDYYFRTHWEMILKEGNWSIGGIGFARQEDPDTVMVGYFVDDRWRNHGIATEACKAVTDFALEQATVDKVIAETPISLIESHKVLTKSGFTQTGETATTLKWTRK